MSVDAFMKVEGASGESKDSNHTGWTDIDSFTWGAIQPHSMASGGGAGVGKVAFQDLNIVAKIDKCYPAVLKHCATGKHLDDIGRHDFAADDVVGENRDELGLVFGQQQRVHRGELLVPSLQDQNPVLGANHARRQGC